MFEKLLYWDERGVILSHGVRPDASSWDKPGMSAILIPWGALRRAGAVQPWPSVVVADDFEHEISARQVGARGVVAFSVHVTSFLEAASARSSARIDWGWAKHPDVEWEPATMPGHAGGSYRANAATAVLAKRRGSSMRWVWAGALNGAIIGSWTNQIPDVHGWGLAIMAAGAIAGGFVGGLIRRRRARTPEPHALFDPEVAITETHVYAKAANGDAFRVERQHLASQTKEEGRRIYTFGRRCLLVLGTKPDDVTRLLDEQLDPTEKLES